MPKTKNFDPKIDVKLSCSCGEACCDLRTVDQETLDKLQIIRDEIGAPMIVNSGARCPLHPKEIGRIDTDHQSCKAVDIRYTDKLQALRIALNAAKLGATGVGIYYNRCFVHLCFKAGNRIRVWIEE